MEGGSMGITSFSPDRFRVESIRSRVKPLRFLLFLLLLASPARADFVGPLITDSADPLETKKVTLEMTSALFLRQGVFDENGSLNYFPSGDRVTRLLTVFRTAYGLFENAEISALIPVIYSWATQGGKSAQDGGLSEILVGGKYRFIENDKNGLRPSVAGVFKVKFPTGKYDHLSPEKLGIDQTGNGSYEYILGIDISKYWERWALHGNLWYDWAAESTISGVKTKPGNTLYYNLAVEYALSDKWNLLLELNGWEQGRTELNGQTADNSEARSLNLLPGLEWRINPYFYTIFGCSLPVLGKNTGSEITPTVLINFTF
jgi:hypothetical protein